MRKGDYKMETSASDLAIGGVLKILTSKGIYLPVAYKSRKLTTGESQ